jgi:membrane protein DedA with SNARE-associated domain
MRRLARTRSERSRPDAPGGHLRLLGSADHHRFGKPWGSYAGRDHAYRGRSLRRCNRLSIGLVILAAIVGAIVGDNIGYAIGHWGGYRILVRYGRYVRLDEAKVKLGRYIFLKHGGKVVFFGRFVSVLRTSAAFLAGTLRMPWWRFFGFNAAGGTLWALIYGLGAYLLGMELDRLTRPVDVVAGIAAAVVIVAFLVFLRRNEKRLEEEAERAFPGPLDMSQPHSPAKA